MLRNIEQGGRLKGVFGGNRRFKEWSGEVLTERATCEQRLSMYVMSRRRQWQAEGTTSAQALRPKYIWHGWNRIKDGYWEATG